MSLNIVPKDLIFEIQLEKLKKEYALILYQVKFKQLTDSEKEVTIKRLQSIITVMKNDFDKLSEVDIEMLITEANNLILRPLNKFTFDLFARNIPDYTHNLGWDYERNSPLRPEDFFEKSEKKVWWIGKCGHSWKTAICIRTQGGNCPFCSGRMVLKGFNDLETLKPELSKEWDYQKNKGITPDNISIGSHKKVWWNCSKGHSWNADIHSRVKGNGCPICAGYRPVVCVETGEIFSGPAEVQAKKGICGSNITLVCKGIRKKAGGYHWRYTDL